MGKYTNGDAVDIIENEGMGYAVESYTNGDSFKDPETVRLWDNASKALTELRTWLAGETGREVHG